MTEEERSWEGWSFDDAFFKTTTYARIQKQLGDSIRRISKELNMPFEDELAELVAKEEIEKKNDTDSVSKPTGNANTTSSVSEQAIQKPVQETITTSTSEPPPPVVKTRQGQMPAEKKIDVDALIKNLKGADLLTDEEKSWITGVDENGQLTWSIDAGELVQDAENKSQYVPENVHCNPYSGRVYESTTSGTRPEA